MRRFIGLEHTEDDPFGPETIKDAPEDDDDSDDDKAEDGEVPDIEPLLPVSPLRKFFPRR